MHFSKSLIVSALLGFAAAKKSSSESIAASETLASTASAVASAAASSSTSTADGLITHTIQVGGSNGSLTFSPNNVKANAGDMIQFQFHPKNHSVVQSTFDNPCVPIQNIQSNNTNAFFSGFMPTSATANSSAQLLTYTIRVPDAKPIWFYCSQAKHCQAGMVGAINAPTSGEKTMEAFAALAAKATENLSPGQSGSGSSSGSSTNGTSGSGSGSGTSGSGTSGSGTATGASGTSSAPAQNTANAAPTLDGRGVLGFGAAAAVAALALL